MSHHLEPQGAAAAGAGSRRMHKRQRVATTTEEAAAARTTTTTRRRATTTAAARTTTRAAATVVDDAAVATSSSFRPGAAASGTATRSVGDTPPTRSRDLNTVDSSAYSVSFATQQTGYSISQKAATTGVSAASTTTDGALPQGALIGIIAGAAGGGVLLLAIIGFCCWKRKKAKKEAEEKEWVGLSGSRSGGGGDAKELVGASRGDLDPWASTDSFAAHGAEKGWAAQSSVSLASLATDEKSRAYPAAAGGGAGGAPYAAQNLEHARAELFASRAAPPPGRSMTPVSMASTAAPQGRQRVATDAFSVNDVISFTGGGARGNSQYPPASSIYPPSTSHASGFPHSSSQPQLAPSAFPPQQPQYPPHSQPSHHSFALAPTSVAPQPTSTPQYPPPRPPRPSEVPSAPPSPFNRALRAADRDTQLLRDEALESRFMAVMTGAVGREEEEEQEQVKESALDERKRKRQSMAVGAMGKEAERRKKDTIVGLADAYAGGGEEEWGEVDLDAPSQPRPPRTDSAPRTNPPQRSSSKRTAPSAPPAAAPPVPSLSPVVDSFPLPPQTNSPRSAPPPANRNRYSSRIDSKPLRELEHYLEKMPSSAGRPFPRVSEASDLSSSFSARRQSRMSVASSVAPLSLPRRPAGAVVPNSGSKDSLSPMTAASGAAHSPYGEPKRYEHSIYSAAGEVGELSSASGSTTSSPSKVRRPGMAGVSPSGSLSPLGTPLSERGPVLGASTSSLAFEVSAGDEEDDVFSSAGPSSSTPPRTTSRPAPVAVTSTRLPPPAPLRLARNASLANRQHSPPHAAPHMPSHPLPSSTLNVSPPSRNPLTMSAAERDVLTQLGLPSPSILSVSTATYDSGERTPDLTRSMSSSAMGMSSSSPLSSPDTSVLDTPQTPHFAIGQPLGGVAVAGESPYLDVLPSSRSPSPSPAPKNPPASVQPMQPKQQQAYLDPLAAGGWESLASMAAAKQDPNYRSATMSVYALYD